MVLASSGPLSYDDIRTEFGITGILASDSLYTNSNSNITNGLSIIPSSGNPIAISHFLGKRALAQNTLIRRKIQILDKDGGASASAMDVAFDVLNSIEFTLVTSFAVPAGDDVGYEWTGFILPPTSGTYTFALTSDDGGDFSISLDLSTWTIVTDHYGLHGQAATPQNPRTAVLTASIAYPVRIRLQQGSGGVGITPFWITPGSSTYATIPFSVFRSQSNSPPSISSIRSETYIEPRIISPSLYTYTSFTFTNAGATGHLGPTLTQCRSAYSAESWTQNPSYFDMTVQGLQRWKVPKSAQYTITAAGAKGGDANGVQGGSGRVVSGSRFFTKDEVLTILVGQMGMQVFNGANSWGGTGGGGTFVVDGNQSAILIAGGGGGASNQGGAKVAGWNAPTSFQGTTRLGGLNTVALGTGGRGAQDGAFAPGGGGFSGNGISADTNSTNRAGKAFVNGGQGGNNVEMNTPANSGGFGGGAAIFTNSSVTYPGGAGGYTGGDASDYRNGEAGGGGGSFFNTSKGTWGYGGLNGGHGYVTITMAQ